MEPQSQTELVRITDFRCIRHVELLLTPLHALVGPNDSGKSTILQAVAAQPRGQPMLFLEEPERGLHPCRIRQLMGELRVLSQRTRILLVTHSPLVINELEPHEVTIVTRDRERGTMCTSMAKTKHFEERAEIYALGELWLSFADGVMEEDLVEPHEGCAG